MFTAKKIKLLLPKILVIVITIQFGVISIINAQSCYELVWSDEFNYSGLPDSTNWSFEVGGDGWGNNELQYYTNKRIENARVEDSMLIIEAKKEAYEGKQYTSARLITYQNNLSWKYGKIEARMKLPYGQGIWPAFWMLNNSIMEGVGWPACGEIDIMELIGGGDGKDNVVYGTIHWADANGNHAQYGGNNKLENGIYNDDFHVFTIEWTDEFIKWFIDGKQYHIVDITPNDLSEFHGNYFILLNIAVGGNWPGNPNSSTVFPQQLMVDYVRVYQLNKKPEIVGKNKVLKAEKSLNYSTIESPEFTYNWILPDDAEIVKGQGTNSIDVNWGCNAGLVKCEITTLCDNYELEFPVEINQLEISGKQIVSEYEKDLEYSVLPTLNTTYIWTLPEMVSSTTEMNSNQVYLNWGTNDGTIKVNTENNCGLDSASFDVKIIRQLPYPDPNVPQAIPGTIESIYYDYGGEGIAYHDNDPKNQGTGSRQDEGVDTEVNDGSENVGWIVTGEWLEYTVKVESEKTYDIEIRTASTNSAGKFKISFNGVDKTGVINVPSTGSWSSFSSVFIKDITLSETDTLMRVDAISGDFNLGRMIFADSIATVLSDNLNTTLNIYPTRVDNFIVVENLNEPAKYFIIDISGRMVKSGTITDNKIQVDEIKEGSYILQIKMSSLIVSKKFIKI